MERPAHTQSPVHELVRRRWSPLAFSDQPVTPAELDSLLEAARWAPSAYNEQPWSFVLATRDEPAAFERLASCMVAGNQVWARHAPVLMLSVAKRRFDLTGDENRHAWYDVGQAVAALSLQATALGLFVHQMAGFSPEQARAALGIPETHVPVTMIAVGRYGDAGSLPAELRAREEAPRERKAAAAFAFAGRWGQPRGR